MSTAALIRSSLRQALAATSACLGLGLVMFFLVKGPAAEAAIALLWTGLGLLVLVPVFNVVAVLLDERRKTPPTFAWVAAAVLALLVWTVIEKIWPVLVARFGGVL
jgi:hypothetical protein